MEKLKKMNLVIDKIDPKTVKWRNGDGVFQSDKKGSLSVSIPRDKLHIKEGHLSLLPPTVPRKSGRKKIRRRMPDGMLVSFPKKNSKDVFIDFDMGLLSQNSNCQNNNPPSVSLIPSCISLPSPPSSSLPLTPPLAVPAPCSPIPSILPSSPPHSCPTLSKSQRSCILKRNSIDFSHTSISKSVFHSNSITPVSVKKAPLSQKKSNHFTMTTQTSNNNEPLRTRKRPLRRPQHVLDSSSDNESKNDDQEVRPLTEPMSDVSVVLPVVYSDPFPPDSHTPIIITHSSHNDVTLDNSEGICIQENVDNVLCSNGEMDEQVVSEPLNVAIVDTSDPILKMEDMNEDELLKDEECVYSGDTDVFAEAAMLLNDTPSCDLSQETPSLFHTSLGDTPPLFDDVSSKETFPLFHNPSFEEISPPISDTPTKTSKDIRPLLIPTEISANNIAPLLVNDTPIKSPIKTPPHSNEVPGEDTLSLIIKTDQEPPAQTPDEAISEVNDTAQKDYLQTSQDCEMTSSSLNVNKTIITKKSILPPPTAKRRVKVRLKKRSPSCASLIVKEAGKKSPINTSPQQINVNSSSGVLFSTTEKRKSEKTKSKVSAEKPNHKILYSKEPTAKMLSKEPSTKPLLCNESVTKPLISEEPKTSISKESNTLPLSHLQFDEMESKHQKRIISFLKSSAAVTVDSTISTSSSSIEPPAKRPRQIGSFNEPPATKSSNSFSFNYDVIKKEKPDRSDDFMFNFQTTHVFGKIPNVFGKTTPTNSAQDVIVIDDDDVISLLPVDTLDSSPSKHNKITSSDNVNPNFKQDQIRSWVAQQQRYPAPPPPGGTLATPPRWSSMRHINRHRNSSNSFHDNTPKLSVSPRQKLDFHMLRLPTSRISPSNLCDYLCGYDQLSVAERHFHEILTLLRALMHCDFATAGDHYLRLRVHHAVHFDANVLTALLQLCSDQEHHDLSPKPPFVAHEVFNDLKSLGKGRVALLDHLNLLRTLIHYQLYSEVTKCYESAPSLDVQITPSHLELMLQAAGRLGPHAMRLLEDATQCLCVKELARYVEGLVSKLDKRIITMYVQQFESWVKHNSEVVLKLSKKTVQILLNVFVESDCWLGGVSLLESCTTHIPGLGSLVVKLVEGILQHYHKGIHQLMNFIKYLSPDQCKMLNEEYWEMLLGFSLQLNLINTSQWLFRTARELYNPISKQVQFQLLCLFIEQDCPEETTEVLKVFLAVPLPSSTYLKNLCTRMKNQPHFALHLYSVCLALLELNVTPPPDCLDWLLQYHSKHEKVYSWLAELVKQASQHKIQFEHEFYENILIQLRIWGKDGEAVTCVYKNLRKTVQSPLSDKRDDIGLDSSSGVGSSPEFSLDSSICGLNFSLHHSSKKESTSSLCSLIKQSGSQGQFVAVAAILSNLPTNAYYSDEILRSTLSAVLQSPLKPVQAFVNLVSSLKSNSDNNILSSHNLWLAGQVGVALLCRCEQSSCWNEGFILLHCLHLHGIHYVGVSPPHALDPPPSPCTVALKAVTICLKVRQLSGVMEVLKGCQFIPSENEKEAQARADILFTLVGEYEKEEHFTYAFICLESAMRTLSSVNYTRVSRTTSSLLTTMLEKGYMVEKATDVLKTLLDRNIVLSCEVFSHFISKLITNGNESQARNLCHSAIEGGWYHVAGTTPYCLVLPCILSSIEVYLLVHHHLNQQPRPSLRDLEIICPSGLRATVETCLSSEFIPPLSITGRSARPSSNVALLVSTMSLSSWYLAHSPSMSENSDKKKTFKRIVCKKVVEELKPYYSNQRFDSVEAYRHLINMIYLHCSKEGKHTNWTVTKEILTKVHHVVKQVMDSISSYGLNTDLSSILSVKRK